MGRALTVALQSSPGTGRSAQDRAAPGWRDDRLLRTLLVALATAALLAGLLAGGAGAASGAGTAASGRALSDRRQVISIGSRKNYTP